jgi:hypothetical protein
MIVKWPVKRGNSMRLIVCLIMALPLIGCGIAPSLNDPKLSNKQLNLEEFFDGKINAYGRIPI